MCLGFADRKKTCMECIIPLKSPVLLAVRTIVAMAWPHHCRFTSFSEEKNRQSYVSQQAALEGLEDHGTSGISSIWRFLKLGTPVHHPFPDGFSIVNHPAIWGYPPFTDTQGLELGDPTHHPEASELSSGSRRPTGSCISLASPAKREGFEKSTSLDIKVQIWKSFAFRN